MTTTIFAHRGASQLAPENTMAAFSLAYEQGAEGIETDVHLTKDDIPVLTHDEHVNRTTNRTGYIKDYTYNQLKQLDAGSWFSPEFTGSRIVSLEEFLRWIKDKPLYFNIELKNNKIDYKYLEHIVYNMVAHFQLLDCTTLSTFNTKSVSRLKRIGSDIDIALLTTSRQKQLADNAKTLGANAVHIKNRLLKPMLVDECHQKDLTVRVFTVNRPHQMLRCYSLGCDGIFSDVPEAAIYYRKIFSDEDQ